MRILTYDSLNSLPERIACKFRFASIGNFFLSLEWFSCLDQAVMINSRAMRVYAMVAESDEPLGLAMCWCTSEQNTLSSLTNYYSSEYRPVIPLDEQRQGELVCRFSQFIADERPRWRRVDFDYLRSDRTDAAAIAEALRREKFLVTRSFLYENWYVPVLDTDFQAFFAARPSQLKNTIARKEKKLLKTHHVDIQLFTSDGKELERGCADYVTVYNNSWKRSEPFPKFIPSLLSACASLGILRLGVLYVDSTPAAAQIWITAQGTALIYKLAYDERYRDLSVGSVLSREMFKIALDQDKVREIDYGVGSEGYKKDGMTEVRTIDRVSAWNLLEPSGLTLAAMQAGKQILKKAAGRLLTR